MSPALPPCPRRPARRSVALWSVLAAGALAACQSATAPAPPAPTPPGTVVPDALLGEWTYGHPEGTVTQRMRIEWFNGTPQYFVARSYANWFVLTFHPDGRYEQLWYYRVGTGSCAAESWKAVQGTATFGEGTFALTATAGRWKYKDNCVTAEYDRPMTAAELAGERRGHLWRFETNPNDGRAYLMIGYGAAYTPDLVRLHFARPR